MSRPEPELVTVIKRLAVLEASELTPSGVAELNRLRIMLQERWPEAGAALAHAYLQAASP